MLVIIVLLVLLDSNQAQVSSSVEYFGCSREPATGRMCHASSAHDTLGRAGTNSSRGCVAPVQ